jgi:glutamate N-acetyltransferase/amino-acid N-acetyltransferase
VNEPFEEICGGVTAPKGFVACSGYCGVKPSNKDRPDVAMIYSTRSAVGAATFTTNRVKAAPVRVSRAYLRSAETRAIIANSGNANACTGPIGIEHAKRMTRAAGRALSIPEYQVLVCSTGRIGQQLPIEKLEDTISQLPPRLASDGSLKAARAIMTSDTFPKEIAVKLRIDEQTVRIGGIAKGAGMIDPNMATMLAFITTDANIPKPDLRVALICAVEQSFNRITVDGDMSTNDTVILLANAIAGNEPLVTSHKAFGFFQEALNYVTANLARMIVEDGEGVTKFVEVHVQGAATHGDARRAAETVAKSALVKCAWAGNDPNWGRLMGALGYSGARMREEFVEIFFDGVIAVQNGVVSRTPVDQLRKIVSLPKFTITIDLHMGAAEHAVYTTDLTPAYVEFNMSE